MNGYKYLMASALIASTLACSNPAPGEEGTIIDRPEYKAAQGEVFNIDALEALGRVSDVKVSPDGKKILFGISYESVEQNKSNNDLYVMDVDGSNLTRITKTANSESGAVWIDEIGRAHV